MRIELTVAAPRPVSPSTQVLFESAMDEVAYIAGGVTTREARGWWCEPSSQLLHHLEDRILVTVLTTKTDFSVVKRRLDALCHDLGDLGVLAWFVEVSMTLSAATTDSRPRALSPTAPHRS
jgi:hypothetical protein